MQVAVPYRLVCAASLLLGLTAASCRGSDGPDTDADAAGDVAHDTSADADAGEPYDWFVQPLGGLIIGTSLSSGFPVAVTAAMYVLDGDPNVSVVPVNTGAAPDSSGAEPPSVTGFERAEVAPMQRLVVSGERIRTDSVAISAYFEIDGAVGVAVPAIAITERSVEVVVPALFDASGHNVGGAARVRLWQASSDGLAVSAPVDGLQLAELPAHPGGTPGAIYAAWLDAAIDDVDEVRADLTLELPSRHRDALGGLSRDLTGLLDAVDRFAADPATPVPLPWSTAEAPVLSAASLELADRLVMATVAALVDELDAGDSASRSSGLRQRGQALDDCRRQSNLPELDEQICDLKREGRVARIGRQLTSLATRFLMGFYLGVVGGAGSAVAGAHSTEVAIAYEMTWAAGSGHVVSWATGTPPPSHAETQAAVTVALADKLAELNGLLRSLYSVLTAGAELDTLTREWRDRIDDPWHPDTDAGDAGSDAPYPDGDDSDAGFPLSGTFEGTFVSVDEFSNPSAGCEVVETATLYVTIGGVAGSGTELDPYTGDVDLFGQIETVHTGPSTWCDTDIASITVTNTRLTPFEGSPEMVYFEYRETTGYEVSYYFMGYVESPTRIEGVLSFSAFTPTNYMGGYDGEIELVRQ